MKKPILTLLLVAWMPMLAAGQAAVPRLEMGGVGFPPINPAAVAWDRASRISVGRSEGQYHTFNQAGAVVKRRDEDGRLFGAALVTEYIAAEVRYMALDFTVNTNLVSSSEISHVGIAIPLGDAVALGIGKGEEVISVPNTEDVVIGGPNAGVSLRLGEAVFLGGAMGIHTRTESGVPDGERNVLIYGAGVRFLGESNGFMAEVSMETRDPFSLEPTPGTTVVFDEYEITNIVAMVLVENIVLGVGRWEQDITNETANQLLSETQDGWMIGWSPNEGFGLNVRFQERVREDSLTNRTRHRERIKASAVYRF